jgi:hypothetical protein
MKFVVKATSVPSVSRTTSSGMYFCRKLDKDFFPIVLSFRATEIIFTGTRTQDSFAGVVAFVSVISSLKQATLVLAPFFYRP